MRLYLRLKGSVFSKINRNSIVKKVAIILRTTIVWVKLIRLKFIAKEKINTSLLVHYVYEGFWGLVHAQQVRNEITQLLDLIKNIRPTRILEIGTCGGGTLFLFSNVASNDAKIISIDLPAGKFGGGYSKWRTVLYKRFRHHNQTIHLLRQDSHSQETFKRVESILNGEMVDFLFIDGDHTYRGVKKDYLMYSQLVRKGGIIALHDIAEHPPETQCDVYKFWNEIKSNIPQQEIINDPNQGWAGIGILYL